MIFVVIFKKMVFTGDLMSDFNNDLIKNVDLDMKKIKKLLGKERFQHTKSVLKAALKLSEQLDVDLEKVKKAALLHDIAKSKNREELIELIRESKWQVDELELSITPVLHAPAGAVIAEKEFKIKDKEILEAIRYHSLGHPKMGKIAQVIYASDFISGDRNFEGLNNIRLEIEINFENGLYLIVNHIIRYQIEQNNMIHPYSNDLRNQLLKKK